MGRDNFCHKNKLSSYLRNDSQENIFEVSGVFSTLSENIPQTEHSNVLTCYFIQPEVAVSRNEKTQEPEVAAE